MRVWLVMAAAAPLFLSACGQSPDEGTAETPDSSPSISATRNGPTDNAAAPSAVANGTLARDTSKVEGTGRYTCAGGLTIQVDHDLAWDVMRLTVEGKTFDLTNMLSDEGTAYRSETGRAPGKSLMWRTKGKEATLIEGPKSALPDAPEQTSIACQRVG